MIKVDNAIAKQQAVIASKIVTLRDERVILDVHLADFYGVETRALKQAVRRNRDRFPDDFLYELTDVEIDDVVSQNVIPSKRHFGGAVPFAFTENGVAMLSGVLNSKKAIETNIAIMRTFTMIRKALLLQKDMVQEIGNIKRQLIEHDDKIVVILEYLRQFEESKQQQIEQANRKTIGFKKPMED
jgi:hypothetical protein